MKILLNDYIIALLVRRGRVNGIFLSKEAREERAREKELEQRYIAEKVEQIRKEQEDMRQIVENTKREYCVWISDETQNFIKELHEKNFEPTWGFEVETDYNTQQGQGGKKYGDVFVFDIPELSGLAFDMESKQMLYFTCETGYYEKFKESNTKVNYKYVFIAFEDIFNVTIEVNSQKTVSTITSKQNVIGRSIVGGILAGDAGAIIGGTTGKNNSVSKSEENPKKIVFNIQTTHKDYPIISFEFNKPFGSEGQVASDKSMVDRMYSIFSGENQLAYFFEKEQKRNCDTIVDYHYLRSHIEPEYDQNNEKEYESIIDYIVCIPNLEIILKRINKFVMQIQSIIEQCNKDVEKDTLSDLLKLVDMKEKGLITEEEFTKLKAKLIIFLRRYVLKVIIRCTSNF